MLNYRGMDRRGRIIAVAALLAVPALGAGLYLSGDTWRQQAAYDRLHEAGALDDVGVADADPAAGASHRWSPTSPSAAAFASGC